jgi:hypothetical protein
MRFLLWLAAGLLIYFLYSIRNSNLAKVPVATTGS